AGAKVLDEYTVQVTFETPYAPFLAYAAAGPLSMVSPKAVRETGDQVHTRPVGSGPFIVKDYVAKDHTTMVRNPAYTRKAPWSDQSRDGQGRVPHDGVPVRRSHGVRPPDRGHARRPVAAPGVAVRPRPGQGAPGRGGVAAGGRRHPDQGRPAPRDRPERDRVR